MANGDGSEQKAKFDLVYPHLNEARLRQFLKLAQSYYLRQDYNACMQHLALLVFELFASRAEPVGRLARQFLPAPECIRLVKTDLGIRVLLSKREFFDPDCAILLSYAYSLSKLIQGSPIGDSTTQNQYKKNRIHIPLRSLAESGAVRIESHLNLSAASGDFRPGNRIKLAILVELYFFLIRRIPQIREQMSREWIRLGTIFHEPFDQVEILLKAHHFYSRLNFAKHVHRMRKETVVLNEEFYWPEKSDYQKLIAGSNESRVLTTIHMGDVVGAFRSISAVAFKGRRAISITPKNDGGISSGFSVADKVKHTSTNANDMNPIAMVAALRKGNTTLAVLFDLTGEFGDTAEVEFFGRKAHFAKGPAQMAIVAKVYILPFVTFESAGRDVLEMAALIDTRCLPGESLNHATIRITQLLATHAEKWIMRNPSQWRYTTSIFNFFSQNREAVIPTA